MSALAAAVGDSADERGYIREWRANLIPGLTEENIDRLKSEFSRGKGAEISGVRPKFCAAYSSSALAANSFARWRNDHAALNRLELASISHFDTLELERACHSGLRGTPPHLDALATGRNGVVAVESKCTEILAEHTAAFRDVYRKRFNELAHPTWHSRFEVLLKKPDAYRFLDAAQLLKHYLGLKNTFPEVSRIALTYVWWEPSNAAALPVFAEHRAEIASFATDLNDPQIMFRAESYPELWACWDAQHEPAWLHEHVASLRARYLVNVELD